MANIDDMPAENEARPMEDRIRWHRLLALAIAACLVLAVVLATSYVVGVMTHRPQLVYPAGANPVATLKAITGGKLPASPEVLQTLSAAFELDPCTVGKKYGALCQDGELTYDSSETACADNGGVKDWIVCR